MHMTATLLTSLLAPVLDADRLIGFYHIGNLELRVHLHILLFSVARSLFYDFKKSIKRWWI